VAINGYLLFEHAVFVSKKQSPFTLAKSVLIGDYSTYTIGKAPKNPQNLDCLNIFLAN
jgi:hypothetical protein